jgi:sulfatase-like protein
VARRSLLAAVVALGALAAPAPAATVAETPVVFVTFDEFPTTSLLDRRGNLDARRFPGFAEFARTSTWFSDTTTVADGTRWAAPIVIGGRLPSPDRMAAWFDYHPNLITLLAPTHRVDAIEPVTRLCPPRLCGRTLPGRDRGEQALTLTKLIPGAKHDAERRSAMAAWIRTIRPWWSGRPPLYFIHVLVPHHPWVWMPDGRRYRLPTPSIPGLHGDNMWRGDQRRVDQGWKRHLLQVGYTDLLLRRLISRLKRVGLWDRSLVAFSADHGVSFVAGSSRRTATRRTVGGIAPVPFFLKAPGQRTGQRIRAHAQTVDVLPTVAHALGLPAARGWDGHSALDPAFEPSPRVDLWSTTSVVRFGRHSYSLAYVRRETARVLARQHARFGSGPMTGAFWANPFTPVRR